jgi:hypothetical protein
VAILPIGMDEQGAKWFIKGAMILSRNESIHAQIYIK